MTRIAILKLLSIFIYVLIFYDIKVLHQHAIMLIHLTYCESWLIQLINM